MTAKEYVSCFLVEVTPTLMCHYIGRSFCETRVKTLALVNVRHPQTVQAPSNEVTVTSVVKKFI
jgi:hypothetical protein